MLLKNNWEKTIWNKRNEKRVIENKSQTIKSSDSQVYKRQFALAYDLMTTATTQ